MYIMKIRRIWFRQLARPNFWHVDDKKIHKISWQSAQPLAGAEQLLNLKKNSYMPQWQNIINIDIRNGLFGEDFWISQILI